MGTFNVERFRGTIGVDVGTMGSLKTKELIDDLRTVGGRFSPKTAAMAFGSSKHKVKREGDGGVIASRHNGGTLTYPALRVLEPEEIPRAVMGRELAEGKKIDVVGVDDGHLFGPGLVQVALDIAKAGKAVRIAMLDRDYRRRPFAGYELFEALPRELVRVNHHEANCLVVPPGEDEICGKPAQYTARLLEGGGGRVKVYVDYLDKQVGGLNFAPFYDETERSDETPGLYYVAACGDCHQVECEERTMAMLREIEENPGIPVALLKRRQVFPAAGEALDFLVNEGWVVRHQEGEELSCSDRLQRAI